MLGSQSSRPSSRMATVSRGDTPSPIRSRDEYPSCSLDLLASGRARGERGPGQRVAGLILEIQSFSFHHHQTVLPLGVDDPNLLSNTSHNQNSDTYQD